MLSKPAEDDASWALSYLFSLRAPSTLLSAEWYPYARYDDAASWCFFLSCRDVPVRLVDAYSGRTRASYGILNHTEKFIGPSAMAFSSDASRLYCAHDANLSVFDISLPGINTHINIKIAAPRRAKWNGSLAGQRGAISCLAIAPDHVFGSGQDLVAVGTFSGTVGLYLMGQTDTQDLLTDSQCVGGWKENRPGIAQVRRIVVEEVT